ncbi:CD276 antigen isoform X1 [Fundulus heteroclitus]|uniref:CD276 antigen isoform X1 n=1 Tax=Fundulus heteroclitus TaxID=8078 RepID=UPI00165B031A|nr:CD276 antigen isoform X1 [Fundulus heteroclitus]
MASRISLFVLLFIPLCSAADSFVKVVCDRSNVAQFGHQSMLTCVVDTTQNIPDLKITLVVWRKGTKGIKGIVPPVVVYDARNDPGELKILQEGYTFADTNFNNRNVSLLISNTKVEDEGEYSCEVTTDSGSSSATTRLKVTARYNYPTADKTLEKGRSNVDQTLVCNASGGYPEGQLRWFDNYKTDWTKSAKLTVTKDENGLFMLSSELHLLKGSIFPEYTCVVYNASGGKEGSISIPTEHTGASKANPATSTIIAPVVVIGSLIVGLLLAVIICKKRSQQQERRPSTLPLMGTRDDITPTAPYPYEPPPAYSVETRDNIA